MTEVKAKWHPVFGSNCPDPALLKTGDLLFPRKPDLSGQAFGWGTFWAEKLKAATGQAKNEGLFSRTIGQILKAGGGSEFASRANGKGESKRLVDLTGYSPDPTRAKLRQSPLVPTEAYAARRTESHPYFGSLLQDPDSLVHPMSPSGYLPLGGGFPGPEDPDFLVAIEAVLKKTFPTLLDDWLDMTVDEFIKHPIRNFLIDALTSADVRLSFFVGHVGIVLREENGHSVNEGGTIYVIEANITDYSHYRVAIHPYHSDSDPKSPNEASPIEAKEAAHQTRGWVNRRCALGEHVWCARPDFAERDGWQDQLVQKSKEYLGRPFGFFDHPKFGDDDRMYCAEFVWRVFKDIDPNFAVRLQDKQTWGAMSEYLKNSQQLDQKKLVDQIMSDKKLKIDACHQFFVLPPALLWNSSALNRPKDPTSGPGYGPTEPYADPIAFTCPVEAAAAPT